MDLHADETDCPLCWICQQPLEGGGPARVWITSDMSLPMHSECWGKLAAEARAELAYRISRDRGPLAKQQQEALKAFTDAISGISGTEWPYRRN